MNDVDRVLSAARAVSERDWALIGLAAAAGLSAQEAVAVTAGEIDAVAGLVRVSRPRRRDAGAAKPLLRALASYARRRRLEASSWLFPSPNPARHLTVRQAERIFARHAEAAGVRKPRSGLGSLRAAGAAGGVL